MNDYLSTVIIAPMTTKAKTAEFRIPITHDKKQGLILLDQIRTIDKTRLLKKIGSSSPKTLQASLRVLQEAFAIQYLLKPGCQTISSMIASRDKG